MVVPVPGLHGAHLRSELAEQLGRRWLASAIATGLVRSSWPGVVIEADRALDRWTCAAAGLLTAGPHAVLTGRTAAVLLGCRSIDAPATQVLMPYEHGVRNKPGLEVHHGGFFVDDIVELDGLRVLQLDRVAADLFCTLRSHDALALADEVLRMAGEEHDVMRKKLAERVRRRLDRRGTIQAASVVDLASPRAEAPPESWLRMQLVEHGFPIPEVNWPVNAIDGQEIFRLDLAWPQLRVGLEYDGYAAHVGRAALDAARAEDLRRRGWIIVRADVEDLAASYRLETELRAAFAERGYSW
jgi:hypothetical protein